MKRGFTFMLFFLLTVYVHGQRSYNYSRRYNTTSRHISNKVAMKKALEKKEQKTPASKPKQSAQPADTSRKKTVSKTKS